jgi:hypothetical protein
VKGKSDYTRRRFRIRKEDLEKFGYTAGCPGCKAANRGTTAGNHAEECRKRLAEELEKIGDERLVRETERLFEYLEEDSKKKRARASEDNGKSRPSASSSGPAVAREAVPRSKGVVPMAMDSGDSVQETVKRKAEDGEREVGDELKDKKNKTRREEERGAKRSVDEWEDLAKRLKTGAEAKAEESKKPGEAWTSTSHMSHRGLEQYRWESLM